MEAEKATSVFGLTVIEDGTIPTGSFRIGPAPQVGVHLTSRRTETGFVTTLITSTPLPRLNPTMRR